MNRKRWLIVRGIGGLARNAGGPGARSASWPARGSSYPFVALAGSLSRTAPPPI